MQLQTDEEFTFASDAIFKFILLRGEIEPYAASKDIKECTISEIVRALPRLKGMGYIEKGFSITSYTVYKFTEKGLKFANDGGFKADSDQRKVSMILNTYQKKRTKKIELLNVVLKQKQIDAPHIFQILSLGEGQKKHDHDAINWALLRELAKEGAIDPLPSPPNEERGFIINDETTSHLHDLNLEIQKENEVKILEANEREQQKQQQIKVVTELKNATWELKYGRKIKVAAIVIPILALIAYLVVNNIQNRPPELEEKVLLTEASIDSIVNSINDSLASDSISIDSAANQKKNKVKQIWK